MRSGYADAGQVGIFEICNEVSMFLPYHVCALNWNSLIVSTTF